MPVIAGALTTTEKVKEQLQLSSSQSSDDLMTHTLINQASALVKTYTKRDDWKYGSTTEQVDGTGDQFVLTTKMPIISVTSFHVDSLRSFGTASLWTENTDFVVEAATGKIRSIGSTAIGRGIQNVQIVYTHGPAVYVVGAPNNTLAITDNGGERDITITEGLYNASSFATALAAALNSGSDPDVTFTVTYSAVGEVFTITMTGTSASAFTIRWAADNSSIYYGKLMGFLTDASDSGALTYTSDEPSPGVLPAIESATNLLCQYWLRLVRERQMQVKAEERGDSLVRFDVTDIPDFIRMQLDLFVHRPIMATY
tara:strand:- start:1837 stop:2775 length:939 start_codon:yes stop_codon:yes gene_type:complete